jgi:hypothetical protein
MAGFSAPEKSALRYRAEMPQLLSHIPTGGTARIHGSIENTRFRAFCGYAAPISRGTTRVEEALVRLLASAVAFLLASGVVASSQAADPAGFLDGAGCDFIVGWSQDPDEPDKPIDVHVYFGGPAGSGAAAVATNAGVYRGDLCTAIGSCAHGFAALSPLALHDGVARDVYAYGIDSQGGNNPQLGNAPRPMVCPPEAQAGVRRRVDDLASLEAWRFSSFWDLLPLGAGAAALTDGPSLPAVPWLVRADDGSPDVWLIDAGGHLRRRVAPEVAGAWHLDLATAQPVEAQKLLAVIEGTALRARPVTYIDGALYLVDDAQPESAGGPALEPVAPPPPPVDGSGGGSGDAGDGGGGGGAAAGGGGATAPLSELGCATRDAGEDARGRFATSLLLVAMVGWAARARWRR